MSDKADWLVIALCTALLVPTGAALALGWVPARLRGVWSVVGLRLAGTAQLVLCSAALVFAIGDLAGDSADGLLLRDFASFALLLIFLGLATLLVAWPWNSADFTLRPLLQDDPHQDPDPR